MVNAMVVFAPDPFLALFFRELYDKNFKDELDGLYAQVNGANKEIVDFISDLYKDCFVIKHYDHSNQGIGFDELYKEIEGDVLATFCSDNFVFKKGIIKGFADRIKNGEVDVVGSVGNHASPPCMADKIVAKNGFVRFNPFMSFWNLKKLKEIDFTFQAYDMEQGDRIEELDLDYNPPGRLDVMSGMTIKYLAKNKHHDIIPPEDLPNYTHASGLSSGVYGHLVENEEKNLAGTGRTFLESKCPIILIVWWKMIFDYTKDRCPLKDFNHKYEQAIKKRIESSKYSEKQIEIMANELRTQCGLI